MLVSLTLNFDLQLGHCVFIRRVLLYVLQPENQGENRQNIAF
jgi:uncharacterized membrane protein